MKIKRLLLCILSVILVINSTSCTKKSGADKLKLVASFYPIYIMALNITDGVDKVELVNMAEQNNRISKENSIQLKEKLKNIYNINSIYDCISIN